MSHAHLRVLWIERLIQLLRHVFATETSAATVFVTDTTAATVVATDTNAASWFAT